MSVRKRKSGKGETTEYHYDFSQGGHRYRGVCEKCTTKRAAEEFERKFKESIKDATAQKNLKQYVEHFRDVLSGGIGDILLVDAYERSLEKPKQRMPSEELIKTKRSYWNDFVAFIAQNYPAVQKITEVLPLHAEAYIQYLRQHGRFNKTVSYSGKVITTERSYQLKASLSAKTINTYQQVLHEVFQLLARDVGLLDNPFSAIPMLKKDAGTREAFSEAELTTIRENLDAFTEPLFTIAIGTALREGDICTLKWSEIDFEEEVITKKMRKTGNLVEIPLMLPIKAYLLKIHEMIPDCDDEYREYVFPELAQMYLNNSSGISYRIKQFLEEKCHIKTTKVLDGRDRAVSVKDLHSCRHTFCYYAAIYGIPLSVVQSIVGHMTPEMTKHYSDHVSIKVKREKMKQLPWFSANGPAALPYFENAELKMSIIKRIEELSAEKLSAVADFLETLAKQ